LVAAQTAVEYHKTGAIDLPNLAVNVGVTVAGGVAGKAAGRWFAKSVARQGGRHWGGKAPVMWRHTLHNWGWNAHVNQWQIQMGHAWSNVRRQRRHRWGPFTW
jgi:hypothetical protein